MAIAAETERLMRNWARWRFAGGAISLAMSGAYTLEAPGRREETAIPLLNGEATDVDRAVDALPDDLKQIVRVYWLAKGTTTQKVRRCRCAVSTFYRRLDQAHSRIHVHMDAARSRSRATARALATRCQTPLLGSK